MPGPMAQNPDVQSAIARRVAKHVSDALKKERGWVPAPRAVSVIVKAVVEGFAALPAHQLKDMEEHPDEVAERVRRLIHELSRESEAMPHGKLCQKAEKVEGSGIGNILLEEKGRQALSAAAVKMSLEEWAGEVVGATHLARKYGIPRSSLNRWHQQGDVIGLLKGTRKRVYPVEQFIDGRPAVGIREIIRLVPSQRVAWLWLNQFNPVLEARPIDLLKQERKDEVIGVAESYFGAA